MVCGREDWNSPEDAVEESTQDAGIAQERKNGWGTLRRSCQFAFRIGIGRARRDEIHPRVPPLPIQRPGVMMSQKMARKNVPL